MPAKDKKHFGRHSYTVNRGAGKSEVLLKHRAYYVLESKVRLVGQRMAGQNLHGSLLAERQVCSHNGSSWGPEMIVLVFFL